MRPACTLAALSIAVLTCLSWVTETGVRAQAKPATGEIRVLPVRGNIYLLSGAGANVVASVGKDGVLLVDSGSTEMSDKLLATVRELSRRVTLFGASDSSRPTSVRRSRVSTVYD